MKTTAWSIYKIILYFSCAYCFNCHGIQVWIYEKCKKKKKRLYIQKLFFLFSCSLFADVKLFCLFDFSSWKNSRLFILEFLQWNGLLCMCKPASGCYNFCLCKVHEFTRMVVGCVISHTDTLALIKRRPPVWHFWKLFTVKKKRKKRKNICGSHICSTHSQSRFLAQVTVTCRQSAAAAAGLQCSLMKSKWNRTEGQLIEQEREEGREGGSSWGGRVCG